MNAKTLRQTYLKFFEEKGHVIIGSSSLIPEHDPSVLFTTAGMHPLVPFLMGEPHPAGKRLTKIIELNSQVPRQPGWINLHCKKKVDTERRERFFVY